MPRGFVKGGYSPIIAYLNARKAKNVKSKGKQSYARDVKQCVVAAIAAKEARPTTAARVIGCSVPTIYNWMAKGVDEKKRGPLRMIQDGSPEKEQLEELATRDPYGRLVHLSEKLAKTTGLKPSHSTVKRQLYKRANPKFSLKVADTSSMDNNLEKLLDMQMGYLDGLNFALSSGRITAEQLFFMDEFPIYVGKVPGKGRARKGKKLYARKSYMYTRYTGVICISNKACIKADVIKGNMDDAQCQRFCLESLQ